MKKVLFFFVILLLIGVQGALSQNRHHHPPLNPIPSFNVPVGPAYTGFRERKSHGTPGREKRDMDVVISSSSSLPITVVAEVWVMNEDATVILGPFTLYEDEVLTVPIDSGLWGVVIDCEFEDVTADVWID